MQQLLAVYSLEFQIPTFFVDADLSEAQPYRRVAKHFTVNVEHP
jgi:hypothetical protein